MLVIFYTISISLLLCGVYLLVRLTKWLIDEYGITRYYWDKDKLQMIPEKEYKRKHR